VVPLILQLPFLSLHCYYRSMMIAGPNTGAIVPVVNPTHTPLVRTIDIQSGWVDLYVRTSSSGSDIENQIIRLRGWCVSKGLLIRFIYIERAGRQSTGALGLPTLYSLARDSLVRANIDPTTINNLHSHIKNLPLTEQVRKDFIVERDEEAKNEANCPSKNNIVPLVAENHSRIGRRDEAHRAPISPSKIKARKQQHTKAWLGIDTVHNILELAGVRFLTPFEPDPHPCDSHEAGWNAIKKYAAVIVQTSLTSSVKSVEGTAAVAKKKAVKRKKDLGDEEDGLKKRAFIPILSFSRADMNCIRARGIIGADAKFIPLTDKELAVALTTNVHKVTHGNIQNKRYELNALKTLSL